MTASQVQDFFANQKVNVAAARDVYARVNQPKENGASETLIWKSSGPVGQSSRLRVGLGQEEEGRGLRQTARGSRDGGDEDGEFRFSCGEGATVVSKGCSDTKVNAAALVPLQTRIMERARRWEGGE